MSNIGGNPPGPHGPTSTPGGSSATGSYPAFQIRTYYATRTIELTVPGVWAGSVDHSGIKMSVDTNSSPENSIIKFEMRGAQGASATATLTCIYPESVCYTMILTCIDP
jgi:hypothetical protein